MFSTVCKAEPSWALPLEDSLALESHSLPFSRPSAVRTWCENGCFLVKKFSLHGALSSCSFSDASVLPSSLVYSVIGLNLIVSPELTNHELTEVGDSPLSWDLVSLAPFQLSWICSPGLGPLPFSTLCLHPYH